MLETHDEQFARCLNVLPDAKQSTIDAVRNGRRLPQLQATLLVPGQLCGYIEAEKRSAVPGGGARSEDASWHKV